jgi:hypothetical protein
MTAVSTATVISQSSSANFQTWVNEVYTQLVTNCGLSAMSASMDSGQMAVPCTTAVPGGATTSAGYYMFMFNDTLAKGAISLAALVSVTAGTGYNGGTAHTFTGVAMSGGTGSGAIATVVLGASGVVSSITITTAGSGYLVGDQLTVTSANIVAAGGASGGGSSGFGFVGVLSSGTPVVIKMEFGSGAAAADPQIQVTVSSGWSSNGTLAGGTAGTNQMTRVACLWGGAPVSTVTSYASRYCYNSTYGYLGLVFKIGGTAANQALGSCFIFRSNDSNGNATGSSVMFISNSITATGTQTSGSVCPMQCAQYAAGVITAITPTLAVTTSQGWLGEQTGQAGMPFGLTTTLNAGQATLIPIYMLEPGLAYSAYNGVALISEAPLGNSIQSAIIGATTLTFLSVGQPFGSGMMGGFTDTTKTFLMLWE